MSRNGSGTYTLPAGQPVVTGTTISASTFNTLTSDLATEMTDSLSRSGKGGMSAALLSVDGAVGAPQYSFTSDSDTGMYRIGANDLGFACNGVKQFELTASAATIVQPLTCSGTATITGASTLTGAVACSTGMTVTGGAVSLTVGTANTSAAIVGNRTAADAGADLVVNSVATRTAGNLLEIQNNTTAKLDVDFSGQIKWPSGPASTATTPAPSAVTAIVPGGGWGLASLGLAYWKDPLGRVHFKGGAQWKTGAVTMITMPAGFRPSSTRYFLCYNLTSGVSNDVITIDSGGVVQLSGGTIANNDVLSVDTISYLAEG